MHDQEKKTVAKNIIDWNLCFRLLVEAFDIFVTEQLALKLCLQKYKMLKPLTKVLSSLKKYQIKVIITHISGFREIQK